MKSRKIVAVLRVKNEIKFLPYTLNVLAEIVDEIIVLDNGSSDGTLEYIKQHFPKIKIILRNPKPLDIQEYQDWNLLTLEASKLDPTWILYTDADEMLSPGAWQHFLLQSNDKNCDVFRYRKISPWKGLDHYRTGQTRFDCPASKSLNPIIVRYNKNLKWTDGKGTMFKKLIKRILRGERFKPSLGRTFPLGLSGKVINNDEHVSLHFNHVNVDNLMKKQLFYVLMEKHMYPRKTIDELVQWAGNGLDTKVSVSELTKVNKDWFWSDHATHLEGLIK